MINNDNIIYNINQEQCKLDSEVECLISNRTLWVGKNEKGIYACEGIRKIILTWEDLEKLVGEHVEETRKIEDMKHRGYAITRMLDAFVSDMYGIWKQDTKKEAGRLTDNISSAMLCMNYEMMKQANYEARMFIVEILR